MTKDAQPTAQAQAAATPAATASAGKLAAATNVAGALASVRARTAARAQGAAARKETTLKGSKGFVNLDVTKRLSVGIAGAKGDGAPTLLQLDRLHRDALLAQYKDLGVDDRVGAYFADMRVRPTQATGFLRQCGGGFAGYDWDRDVPFRLIKPDLADRLRPRDWTDLLRPSLPDAVDARSWEEIVKGVGEADLDPGRSGLGKGVDLMEPGVAGRVRVDEARLEKLLEREPTASDVGEMVVYAQALLARGDDVRAAKLATRAAQVDARGLDGASLQQVRSLAPAIAFLATGAAGAADAALAKADVTSKVARQVRRQKVRSARAAADQTFVAAARAFGPNKAVLVERARQQYLEVLVSAGMSKEAAQAALPLQSGAAVLDVVRSVGVATQSSGRAVRVRSPADRQFDGRTLPPAGAAWLMTSGGLSTTLDPAVRAQVLHAFGRLRLLYGPALSNPSSAVLHMHGLPADGVPLGGDLFRFDWLLGEVRRLADDVARIEALILQFKQMVLTQALSKTEAFQVVAEEVTRAISELVVRINATSAQVAAEAMDLAIHVRDRALVIGIVNALKAWPHTRWLQIISASSAAVAGGANVHAAVMAEIRSWLAGEIGTILTGVRTDLVGTLQALTSSIRDGPLVPDQLLQDLAELAEAAGLPDADDNLLAPLRAARDAFNLETAAQPALDSLNTTTVPTWAENLLALYVVAPFVAAILVFAPAGAAVGAGVAAMVGVSAIALSAKAALFVGACALLIGIGLQYVTSAVLLALGDAIGLVAQLDTAVAASMNRIRELVATLAASLTGLGTLQSLVDSTQEILESIEGQIPEAVRRELLTVLEGSRDVVLHNAHLMLGALQRSFFRETLEYVDAVPPFAFNVGLPGGFAGSDDRNFGASALVLRAASEFEAARVARATARPQLVTQVLSLHHLLQLQSRATGDFDDLLQGEVLTFAIDQVHLDRVAPGLHRALVKDVEVHVDFEPTTEAQKQLAAIGAHAAALAGTRVDPALDGRIPTGGFPGLPVAVGRIPTGIPALLTHKGKSMIRLKPSETLLAAYEDPCGGVCPPPPALTGTRLLDDLDPEANQQGWRVLEITDAHEDMLFSHFDVLQDGIRFIHPMKHLKPFEHRGLVGEWDLEIPALRNLSVLHQLPAIRDVRLVVSLVTEYDNELAKLVPTARAQVTDPPVNHPLPLPDLPPLPELPEVQVPDLDELIAQLEAMLQSVSTALEGVVDAAGTMTGAVASLEEAINRVSTATDGAVSGLSDVARTIEEALAQATDALETATVVRLSGALQTPSEAGNHLVGVMRSTQGLSATQLAAALTGAQPVEWTVNGLDATKIVRTARISLSGLPAVVTPLTLPVDVTFEPTAGAPVTRTVSLTNVTPTGTASVLTADLDPAEFPPAATNPMGVWKVKLPVVPVAQLTDLVLGMMVEMGP